MATPSQAIQNLASLKTDAEVEVWAYPDGYALFVKNKTFKENAPSQP